MNDQDRFHLQQEQILWAVIDEGELAGDARQHIQNCPVCMARIGQLRDELQDFGRKARNAVPSTTRTVKLPSQNPAADSFNNGWLPFLGAAAMAGFAIFFYFMGLTSTIPPGQINTVTAQVKMLEDESLMREISELVDDPVFGDIYEITGEDDYGFDDDFLQFVVPDVQDDFQSEFFQEGGTMRC